MVTDRDIPDCPAEQHAWVSGGMEEQDGGVLAIVSRQCRKCGYVDELPRELQMRLVPTHE